MPKQQPEEIDELPSDSEFQKDVEKRKLSQSQSQNMWQTGRAQQMYVPEDKNLDDSDDEDDDDYGIEKPQDLNDDEEQSNDEQNFATQIHTEN